MLSGIFRIILFAFLAYIVYWIYRFFKALIKSSQPQEPASRRSNVMVKDEMCNTYLPQEDALKEVHKGKTYYFCSQECRRKFLEQKKTH